MTGEKYMKVHWRWSEELERREGGQTMGHHPMVML